MKYFLLVVGLLFSCVVARSQYLYGYVTDSNAQYIPNHMIMVTTDTVNGVPFPYSTTAYTNTNGQYFIPVDSTIPNGVIFVISTLSCNNIMSNSFLYQGNSINCSFSICATSNYIHGWVTLNDTTTPADEAIVYLIQQEFDINTSSYILTALDSVEVDSGSAYYSMPIPTSVNGSLLVKGALLPTSGNYINYLPAYYNSSALQWNTATPISNANTTARIVLPMGMNNQGQGFISGSVLQGANKTTAAGDPLYKRILLLTTINDDPVAYRYSDIDGTFSFGGLAYGTYKLFGDAPGKANPPVTFSLSPSNPSLTDIVFEEDSSSFMGFLWPLSVNTSGQLQDIKIYPNPAKDLLVISGLNAKEGNSIEFMSITGSVIYSQKELRQSEISISMKELASGFYILRLSTVGQTRIYNVVK